MSVKSELRDYLLRSFRYVFKGIPIQKFYPQLISLKADKLLQGRVALITGGTSGIGFEIGKTFVNAGAKVIITGRSSDRLDGAIKRLKDETNSNNVYGIVLDNLNPDRFHDGFQEAVKKAGSAIDILVNNAGILGGADGENKNDEFDRVIDTNLKGPFLLTELFATYMINNGIKGNILFVASSSSLRPAINPYTFSKWGIRGLTLGMAKKLIKHGIVVNGVAPGPTATPMMRKEKAADLSLPNNPSGRYTMPEEVANIALVLVSDMGRQIVGDIIYISGGAGVITYDDIHY